MLSAIQTHSINSKLSLGTHPQPIRSMRPARDIFVPKAQDSTGRAVDLCLARRKNEAAWDEALKQQKHAHSAGGAFSCVAGWMTLGQTIGGIAMAGVACAYNVGDFTGSYAMLGAAALAPVVALAIGITRVGPMRSAADAAAGEAAGELLQSQDDETDYLLDARLERVAMLEQGIALGALQGARDACNRGAASLIEAKWGADGIAEWQQATAAGVQASPQLIAQLGQVADLPQLRALLRTLP